MRCTYIRLRGYNRFNLGQVRDLIITPENLIQLVLGSNGAGKSSLLAMLLPTVPERADFDQDGLYEHHSEHRGKTYKLISHLKSGFKHEFYIDDSENLNVGGTAPAQWRLIEEHFETTDELNRLMLGTETAFKFTEMAPMKRREWLTKICPVNVEYALQLFQVVKQQARSLKAINDHTLGKLLVSRTKLEEMRGSYNQESLNAILQSERRALENMMGLPLFDSQTDSSALYVITSSAKQFVHALITQITQYRGRGSAKEQETRAELKEALVKARGKLDAQKEELLNLDNMIDQVNQAGVEDIDQLKQTLALRRIEIDNLGIDDDSVPTDIQPNRTFSDFSEVHDVLRQLMLGWVDTDNTFTESDAKTVFDTVEKMERAIRTAKNRIAEIEDHLQHLAGAPETTCPKCHTQFIVGVQSGQSKEEFERRLERGKKWLAETVPEYEQYQQKLAAYRQWDRDVAILNDTARKYPGLRLFWDELFEYGRKQGYGSGALTLLGRWYQQFERWDTYLDKQRDITHMERVLERIGTIDLRPMLDRREVLYKSREELLETVEQLVGSLSETESRLEMITDINTKLLQADKLDETVKLAGLEFLDYLYTKTLRKAIADTIRNINDAEQRINEMNSDVRLVEDLEKTQTETEKNLQYAELVMKELNPSNGLIADTLAGPINAFIEYINSVIAQFWEYDLRILPCAIDANGLNYRFPLLSEKSDNPRKDIVNGSNGQKEAINQAFIIAMMHYKGFHDWPLLLDEFASTFDPQHQTNAMDFIRILVDTNRVSQVWFISHYVINHVSFNNAQSCVLDKTNIILPEKYNEHVQLL